MLFSKKQSVVKRYNILLIDILADAKILKNWIKKNVFNNIGFVIGSLAIEIIILLLYSLYILNIIIKKVS